MSKYKIDITKPALKDLDYIIYYIVEELKEPKMAKKLYEEIISRIKNLSEYPKTHAVIENKNLRYNDYRKLVVGKYLVFYRLVDGTNIVQVDRIMYGGMGQIIINTKIQSNITTTLFLHYKSLTML